MATQEFDGKPCNIGTKNCRQPDQCPISNIMHIRLNILMNTLAILRNCKMRYIFKKISQIYIKIPNSVLENISLETFLGVRDVKILQTIICL